MRVQEVSGQSGLGIGIAVGGRVHQRQREQQALADALAQFLGGGLGKRDGEHLAHAQPALHHQPCHQCRESERFAGTGGGLDEAHAIERQFEIGIAGGGGVHSASSPAPAARAIASLSSTGAMGRPDASAANTDAATRANSVSADALANGSRPRKASA